MQEMGSNPIPSIQRLFTKLSYSANLLSMNSRLHGMGSIPTSDAKNLWIILIYIHQIVNP